MKSLEQLFAVGFVSETFDFKGGKVTLTVLDTSRLTDALNAAYEAEPSAQLLAYKKQILARAITHVNNEPSFKNPSKPTKEEVEGQLSILDVSHYSSINYLYEKYDEMDNRVSQEVSDDSNLKK